MLNLSHCNIPITEPSPEKTRLRHSKFVGLCDDKDASSVGKEHAGVGLPTIPLVQSSWLGEVEGRCTHDMRAIKSR